MRKTDYIPQPTRHAKGHAVVRLNGRDFYLGPFGSADAKAKYETLLAEWLPVQARSPVHIPLMESESLVGLVRLEPVP